MKHNEQVREDGAEEFGESEEDDSDLGEEDEQQTGRGSEKNSKAGNRRCNREEDDEWLPHDDSDDVKASDFSDDDIHSRRRFLSERSGKSAKWSVDEISSVDGDDDDSDRDDDEWLPADYDTHESSSDCSSYSPPATRPCSTHHLQSSISSSTAASVSRRNNRGNSSAKKRRSAHLDDDTPATKWRR